jgi:hypothetical protein
MSERATHTFEFPASVIATAARAEAEYHEERSRHWTTRADKALGVVRATIGAKVIEQEVTGGTRAAVVVEYGDLEAWREYELAFGKIASHRTLAERYRTDQRVYETQGSRPYALDTDDVHHFRLGGQGREE